MLIRSRSAVLVGAVALGLAGCGQVKQEPVRRGPASAVFTVPGDSTAPSPSANDIPCPRGTRTPVRGPARSVRVLGVSGRATVAPRELQTAREITLTCVRWRGWGSDVARGQGVARILECQPNCATGRIVRQRARIRLMDLRRCPKGPRYYDRAVVTLLDESGTGRPVSYLNRACR